MCGDQDKDGKDRKETCSCSRKDQDTIRAGESKEAGSNARTSAIIIFQGAATLAGKDTPGVQFLAAKVAEMTGDRIGKELTIYRICPIRYLWFFGLISTICFIHVVDY